MKKSISNIRTSRFRKIQQQNKTIIESLTKKMPEITIHRLDKAIKMIILI